MNLKNPKYSVLPAGLVAGALYAVLFSSGLDAKGLPRMHHWSHIALWILTAAVGLAIMSLCRNLRPPKDSCSASAAGAVGCLAAAAGCFLFGTPSAQTGTAAIVDLALRILSGVALCALAYCRYAGKKPLFLLHSLFCVYLAFRMVNQYRIWCADPQIVQYCFYLGAYVALILTCYQFAAFDADCGNPRKLWTAGLPAIYLCAVSLAGPQEQVFMLCCLIWLVTNLRWPKITEEV